MLCSCETFTWTFVLIIGLTPVVFVVFSVYITAVSNINKVGTKNIKKKIFLLKVYEVSLSLS